MSNGHGGKRPGAGRRKGSLTSQTREIVERATREGVTPLEVMLAAMLHYHEVGNRDRAAEIARHAAPYVHPRLSAVAVSGGDSPVRLRLVEEIVMVSEVSSNGDGHPGADDTAAQGAG